MSCQRNARTEAGEERRMCTRLNERSAEHRPCFATLQALHGDRNRCPNCCEYFNSTAAFDRHRTGSFGTAADPRARRRCLKPEEMRAKGMAVNRAGFWITEPHPDYLANDDAPPRFVCNAGSRSHAPVDTQVATSTASGYFASTVQGEQS